MYNSGNINWIFIRKLMKTDNTIVKRIVYIDIAKGIGMLLVIMGHLLEFPQSIFELCLKKAIYCFHMPLFFMLSGMLYKPIARKTIMETLKASFIGKKFLIISYVVYSSVYIIWDIGRFLLGQIEFETIMLDGFKTIVFDGINVLWFISTLLLSEMIFDILFWLFKKNIVKIGACIIFLCTCSIIIKDKLVPYASNRIFVILITTLIRPYIGLLFIFIGFLIMKYGLIVRLQCFLKSFQVRLVFLLCCIFSLMLWGLRNGFVDIHNIALGDNALISVLIGGLLSFFVISLCSELDSKGNVVKLLLFCGRNSLFIMATHNFLGIRTFSELISSQLVYRKEGYIFLSFIIIIILEILLVFLVGERFNRRIKIFSKAV